MTRFMMAIAMVWMAGSVATDALATPEEDYAQYCALCHGEDRRGYANDNAPSLVTSTLFAAGLRVPVGAISYGRPGTPMGPYLDEVGGPMSEWQINALARWLSESAGIEPQRRRTADLAPIRGDAAAGQLLYDAHCAECHGANGEGGEGTALGNPTMLATTPDLFLKAAITDGRDGTPMRAFGDEFSEADIDNIVTFLRSRASGWDVTEMQFARPPTLDNMVLNPDGEPPTFKLDDDRYVSADDLHAAIEAGHRMILIDTRVPYFWAMAHIAGSVPVPYYSSRDEIIDALPQDDTWIVAYCECPRAAADSAVNRLRRLGYENTAVLWEGYAGWAALGYPIAAGSIDDVDE
ncbi:MAG: c-type cytochrome [Pseudomonadota bacterium]